MNGASVEFRTTQAVRFDLFGSTRVAVRMTHKTTG